MAQGGADATLVAAAYRMGMANVPIDTSKIFLQQYQALAGHKVARYKMFADATKSLSGALTKGIEAYGVVAREKELERKRGEIFDLEERLSQPDGTSWDVHYNKKNGGPDEATLEYSRNQFEVIKNELKELEKGPTDKKIRKKIEKLRKSILSLREENNNVMGDYKSHSEAWAKGYVDDGNSFKKPDGSVDLVLKQLYNDIMDSSINLNEANIRPSHHPQTGQRGYFYDPNNDRLALRANIYNRNNQPGGGEIVDQGFNKRLNDWIDQLGKTTENVKMGEMPAAPFEWISHNDLMGMVKLKDVAVVNSINGKATEAIAQATEMKKVITRNADGTFTESKNKEYKIGSYGDMSVANEDAYFDMIMSPTREGEGGTVEDRDVIAGITYMSNNEISFLGKKINYGKDSKSNPNITTLTYSKLGLTGESVDANRDGILQSDELTQEDKNAIHYRLMNPQNQQQAEVSAKELARYLNLQTQKVVEDKRGGVRSTVVSPVKKKKKGKVVNLPWEEGLAYPSNIQATNQYDLVQDVLSGRTSVRSGDDLYTLQKNGKYKLTGRMVGKKEHDLEGGPERTAIDLITKGGGIYGNIPRDFDLDEYYASAAKSKKKKKKKVDEIIDEALQVTEEDLIDFEEGYIWTEGPLPPAEKAQEGTLYKDTTKSPPEYFHFLNKVFKPITKIEDLP